VKQERSQKHISPSFLFFFSFSISYPHLSLSRSLFPNIQQGLTSTVSLPSRQGLTMFENFSNSFRLRCCKTTGKWAALVAISHTWRGVVNYCIIHPSVYFVSTICIFFQIHAVHLPLYDKDSDDEDGHAHDKRQTNHNSDRQFCM